MTYIKKALCSDASTPGGNPGKCEFRVMDLETRKFLYESPLYFYGTNNIAEFLGVVKALEILHLAGDLRPVYTDSMTAITWVKNKRTSTSIDPLKGSEIMLEVNKAIGFLRDNDIKNMVLHWNTKQDGEIPADFGRK